MESVRKELLYFIKSFLYYLMFELCENMTVRNNFLKFNF